MNIKHHFSSLVFSQQRWSDIGTSVLVQNGRNRAVRSVSWYRGRQKIDWDTKKAAPVPAQRGIHPRVHSTKLLFPSGPARLWNAFPTKDLKIVCLWPTTFNKHAGKHSRMDLGKKAFPLFWNGLTNTGYSFRRIYNSQFNPISVQTMKSELDLTLTSCISSRSPKKKRSLRTVT